MFLFFFVFGFLNQFFGFLKLFYVFGQDDDEVVVFVFFVFDVQLVVMVVDDVFDDGQFQFGVVLFV